MHLICEIIASHSGFNVILWSAFLCLILNNLVLIITSFTVLLPSFFVHFALYSPILSGWPVVAGCGYVRLFVTFYLLDAEQIWQALSFMQVKSTNDSDTLQKCIPLLASRMNLSVTV